MLVSPGYSKTNANGTVNTSGTAVTWVSGTKFSGAMIVNPIWINNVAFTISTVNSPTSITLTATAGTQTGVTYLLWGAETSIGGIVGAFTDASGNIVTTFDWASWGGVTPAGAFTLTAAAAPDSSSHATFAGTITGGGSNAFAGFWFTITGFTKAGNNGTFYCAGSTTSTLIVVASSSLTETHAGSAQQLSDIVLRVPAGATTLSLGINDTQLYDNTGSFDLPSFW